MMTFGLVRPVAHNNVRMWSIGAFKMNTGTILFENKLVHPPLIHHKPCKDNRQLVTASGTRSRRTPPDPSRSLFY